MEDINPTDLPEGWDHLPTLVEQLDAAFAARGLPYRAAGTIDALTITDGAAVVLTGDCGAVYAWIDASGFRAMPLVDEAVAA